MSSTRRVPRTRGIVTATVVLALLAGEAGADKSPMRGSTVAYRNAVTAYTLDQDAELTYDPYYAMMLDVSPRYWLTDDLDVHASFGISKELTDSNWTSERHETIPGDLSLGLGIASLGRIPIVDIDTSAGLDFKLPTSPSSRARTLLFGVTPRASLSRRFGLLEGLTLSYGLAVSRYEYDFTTGELESERLPCAPTAVGCDRFLNSGVRNVTWRMQHRVGLSLGLVDWLSVSIGAAAIRDYLHDAVVTDDVNFVPHEPTDTRELMGYDMALTVSALSPVIISIGSSTVNPQLDPSSSAYRPFFNRFTTLFVDLRLDAAALVDTASEEG